jgi:CRISPR system Cascade subunit CasA
MSLFNLIDEKWIPVRFPDGTRDELGIRDTLMRSGGIAAIEDPSPLVVAALHRFLLAVLYRALEGPTDIDQAKALFKNGLPSEKITAYLEKWKDRFWLFDEKYPFFQIPKFEPDIWRTWTVLAAEHNADNAKVLFDHVDVTAPGKASPASCARWMLATQTFSVSAGKSELSHTGTAPSATSVMILPQGQNLSDTILFSLVPENRVVIQDDKPVWEMEPETVEFLKTKSKSIDSKGKTKEKGPERLGRGLVDRYAWRIRAVRLTPDEDGYVSRIAFASGVGFKENEKPDPMLGYRIDDKRGKLPIQFRDRGLWRDFDSLLPDESHLAPRVIEHATVLTRSNRERFPRSVIVLGQATDKAKIKYWRMERFALPEALSGDRMIRTEIGQLLKDAEDAQKSLWLACRSFARDLLSRSERDPAGKDIKGFVEQMPVNPWYWSTLESRFHEMLREYTLDRDSEDIRCQWLKSVRYTLQTAWGQHSASVAIGDAWAIRALVRAEGPLRRKLRELYDEITKLEPQKEEP